MRCENCDAEIVSCRFCGLHFFIGQKIKCESAEYEYHGRREHSHFDCGVSVTKSRVVK
jgi:hypothetical protein